MIKKPTPIKSTLMLQGTGSSVGKSLLVMGLCRLLYRRGYRVAPFKPQNMSNNAMVTHDGGEIGRAQALQAMASHLLPSYHFNPVLLKPMGNNLSQLVVHGQVKKNVTAKDYYRQKKWLLKEILSSYQLLQQEYDMVIVEGAGSPSEINLRRGDIANMGFAEQVKCPVIMVADVERGGAIASLVGTKYVLSPSDNKLIKGFIINKWRGDESLFAPAIRDIKKHTHWKHFGTVPYFDSARFFPEEDSLSFQEKTNLHHHQNLVALCQTPTIAQTDDILPLQYLLEQNNMGLMTLRGGEKIPNNIKLLVLMGSKNTLRDLAYLKKQKLDKAIIDFHHRGGVIIGLCGGYQILGQEVHDPHHIEQGGRESGLGLLPITTRLEKEKKLSLTTAKDNFFGKTITGYEIHVGKTTMMDNGKAWLTLQNGTSDGTISDDKKIFGCYLHGLFHNHEFLLSLLRHAKIPIKNSHPYNEKLEQHINDFADLLEQRLDMKNILALLRK